MPYFVVNSEAQAQSRDHEVHDRNSTKGCLPTVSNQIDLGWHQDCHSAVRAAKRIYAKSDGCYYCANACHSG